MLNDPEKFGKIGEILLKNANIQTSAAKKANLNRAPFMVQ